MLAALVIVPVAFKLLVGRFASPDMRRFLFSARGVRPTGPDGSYVRGDYLRGSAKMLVIALLLVAVSTIILVFVVESRPVQEYPYLAHLYSIVLFGLGAFIALSGFRYLYVAIAWPRLEDQKSDQGVER